MYRVIWANTALTELATIWNNAPASDAQLLVWAVADLAFSGWNATRRMKASHARWVRE
ncbi:MAG: hypothetical protein L0241_15550 [Planctomycetia bacterium]|nr:hypothetical protein [Planctomycetia bacterium]